MSYTAEEINRYIIDSKTFELVTSDENGTPQIRTMGGYGAENADIYFITSKTSAKVAQLKNNPQAVAFIQHEGQDRKSFKNITVYGKAELLTGEEAEKGYEVLHFRRPDFKEDREVHIIYRIQAREIKVLDFSKEDHISIIKADDLK